MTLADHIAARLAAANMADGAADDEGDWLDRSAGDFVPAAVLVAFVDRPQPTLLLTRRQAHLRSHAGQVAFPGGRKDATDVNAVETALREAREEIGLKNNDVHVIGEAPSMRTGTGYIITPVLAVIPPNLPLVAEPGEVARVFEAACDHVFDPAQLSRRSVDWQGATRHYWETHVDGERIWGVTASMIRSIGRLLRIDEQPGIFNREGAV